MVDESGDATDECLPIAPDSARVDLATPTFSKPTSITNPLHPTSAVAQTIYGGQVDNKPFRTEVTLMPGTKPIQWRGSDGRHGGSPVRRLLDGRIHEVALDWFAQADDGSVWYFGEDVFNFEDGRVADTKGTWIAGDETPAAMIMPAQARVGDVYRPENAPGVVFEQVRVEKIDQTIPGPSGDIIGAIEVMELHMDGTSEGKVFAPGYGEFSTGTPGGDLEAVSLASPTDSRKGPAPAQFGTVAGAASDVFDAVSAADAESVKQASTALGQAWDAVLTTGIPPQMKSQMTVDIDALNSATRRERLESCAIGGTAHRAERARSAAAVSTGDRGRPGPSGIVGTPASGRYQRRRFGFGSGRCGGTGSDLGAHPTKRAGPWGGGRGDARA